MYTVLTPRVLVGITLWAQQNGPFEIWERACQSIDASYRLPSPFDDPYAWRTGAELENALLEAGFEIEKTEEVMMPFPFDGAQKFLEFWFGARNPAVCAIYFKFSIGRMIFCRISVLSGSRWSSSAC